MKIPYTKKFSFENWRSLLALMIACFMFSLSYAQPDTVVVTSFEDDFSAAEIFEGWDTGARSHTLSLEEGALKIAVDKPSDAEKWDGLSLGFGGDTTILDLSQNGGYFSVKLKSDLDCTVDIAVWDTTGQYNPGNNKINLVGGADWVILEYEYAGDNLIRYKWNGDSLGVVDASAVHHLLMTFNGGVPWTGNVWMDDLMIGDAAVPPTIISSFEDDFSAAEIFEGWDLGARSHTLSLEDGALKIAVDKPSDAEKWDGITMNFGENTLLDLSSNGGYFAVDLKSDGDCTVDISTMDDDGQYNPGNNKLNLVGGADWVTLEYEYAGDNLIRYKWNGDSLGVVNAAGIHHLLMTFNGGAAWTGNVWLDNLAIGDAAVPPTIISSFEDDFSAAEIFEGWDLGARSHTLSLEDGALKIAVDKPSDAEKWDGITMNFGENTLLDLSSNGGYFAVDLKSDGDCTVDISTMDDDGQYNPGNNQISLVAGADWITLEFEYSGDNLIRYKWNGDSLGVVNAAGIHHLLMTFNGGTAWTGNVWLDNLAIGDAAVPSDYITSFEDDFSGAEIFEGWDMSARSHTLTLEDGALKIAVDKPTDAEKWDGITMNFGENTLLDLSSNGGYFSVDLKSDGDVTVDISTMDDDGQYNPGNNQISLVAGADWITLEFEYSGDNLIRYKWNGDSLGVVNAAGIHHLLMTFNGGTAWTGNVWLDNLAIGDAAVPADIITTFMDDFEDSEVYEGWDMGARSHTLTIDNGTLKVAVDKPSDAEKWDGITMNFGENTNLDLTGSNGVFAVKLKSDADVKVDISTFDAYGEYNPGNNTIDLVGGADWVLLTFQYSGDNLIHYKWNGDSLGVVDPASIDHLLLTFNGGSPWTGNVWMDDLMIGDAAIGVGIISEGASLVKIYPNPATDIINIDNYESIRSLEIWDVTGKMLISIKEPQHSISVGQLSNGIYFLRSFDLSGGVYSSKVVIRK